MKFVISTLIVLCSWLSLKAQQVKDTTNIKVGLVLSGGGAKGLAHIGVLKVIDQLNIKLDYIGGSSMGAIVGGLYASGYTAKQLDSIFQTVNFNDLVQDKLSRKSKTFYEKEDSEKYALTLPIVNKKITLPKGISNGQNFYNFYSKLTTHVRGVNDFKKLPIPFFCTGTNIETGEGLIFDKGYLPDVVAASGALPTVYSPVQFKGKLITDGGITDNYPVEEIRRRGIELVIGVDVQDTLMNKKELSSLPNIMLQISNFKSIKAMKKKIPLTDIYIKPDIKDYSVLSFEKGNQIILQGEKAAKQQKEALAKIAKLQLSKKGKAPVNVMENIMLTSLKIKGSKRHTRAYVKGKLKIKEDSNLNLDKLTKGLDNLYGTNNYEHIRYHIGNEEEGKNEITINVQESDTKSFVRFGLHYDDLYKSAALVNYTRKNLLFKNDVISLDFILGDRPRYNINYYVDKGYYWSVGLNHRLYQYQRSLDFDFLKERLNLPEIPINFFDFRASDLTTQLYLQTVLNQGFEFVIGIEHKYLKNSTETFGQNEKEIRGTVFNDLNYYSLFSTIKFDTYNDKYFPKDGVLFQGSFSAYPFSSIPTEEFEEFAVLKASLGYAIPITKNISGLVQVDGGLRIGEATGVNSLDFFLGGFGSKTINNQIPFYGYDFLQLSGESYTKFLFQLNYNFFKKHHFNAVANFANLGAEVFDLENVKNLNRFSGYAFGYGYESPIGPVQVKYTFSGERAIESAFFFSVGYWF